MRVLTYIASASVLLAVSARGDFGVSQPIASHLPIEDEQGHPLSRGGSRLRSRIPLNGPIGVVMQFVVDEDLKVEEKAEKQMTDANHDIDVV